MIDPAAIQARRPIRFQQSKAQISTTFDQKFIILSLSGNEYFSLDEVGSYIWSLLSQPISLAELTDRLGERYAIDPETCHRDVSRLLTGLRSMRTVSITRTVISIPLLSEVLLSMLLIELVVATRGLAPCMHAIRAMARVCRRTHGRSEQQLRRIPSVIVSMAQIMPGQHLCLSRSLTALFMYRRRRLPVTFHIGARLANAPESASAVLLAHAWVEYRGQDLFGGSPREFAPFPQLLRSAP